MTQIKEIALIYLLNLLNRRNLREMVCDSR